MNVRTVTLQLPENLYLRLQQAAQSTKQSLNDVFLHAVQVGSPPGWEDIPAEFQADVAALDRLDDATLWRIARQKQSSADMKTYQELLVSVSAAKNRRCYQEETIGFENSCLYPIPVVS